MNSQLWRRSVYTIRLRTFSGSTTERSAEPLAEDFDPARAYNTPNQLGHVLLDSCLRARLARGDKYWEGFPPQLL